jgi:hypothetical protein
MSFGDSIAIQALSITFYSMAIESPINPIHLYILICIIAPHGAALINLAWCQPGTHVIEMLHAAENSYGHFFWLSGSI